MDILCYLGVSCCNSPIDPTRAVGHFLPWYELLGIGGIIFAATQFMEAAKLRNYIFRLGYLLRITAVIVGISVVAIATANFIQLSNSAIPLISYPAFYELIALILLSLLLLTYVLFLINPRLFLPRFSGELLNKVRIELLSNLGDENLAALSRFINFYLEKIIKSAAESPTRFRKGEEPKPSEQAQNALHFIDVDLSNHSFTKYVAVNSLGFIVNFIKQAEKCKLWESGGNIFVNNLSESLFTDDNSLLSRELMSGGYSGIHKPLGELLFKSEGILSHYRIFQSFRHWTSEISTTTLTNWTHGLDEALRFYFSEERNIYSAETPNEALSYSLKNLAEAARWIAYKADSLGDKVWDSEYTVKLSTIGGFFGDLERVLVQQDPEAKYKPVFSDHELNVKERSVTEGIAEALFTYLDACTVIKHEEYARTNGLRVMWLLYRDSINTTVINNIRNKVSSLVQERFEKNLKGGYSSMIKFMLNVYGGIVKSKQKLNHPIQELVREQFQRRIATETVRKKKFREQHLPQGWPVIPSKGIIYRTLHNRKKEILFRTRTLKRKKS